MPPFDPQRFIVAQEAVYDTVRAELQTGRKRSHWMWFIFPQLSGLGCSDMARRYALSGIGEAGAYLAHPLLGARLLECATLAASIEERTIGNIFGTPDDMKFHSSMTLFAQTAAEQGIFQRCLDSYFNGRPDPATLALL